MGASHNMNTVLRNNRLLLGKRKRLHEQESPSLGTYRKMEDHKQFNDIAFVEFQKEQFLKRKKEKRKEILIRVSVVIITFLIVLFFLWLWSVSNSNSLGPHPDF